MILWVGWWFPDWIHGYVVMTSARAQLGTELNWDVISLWCFTLKGAGLDGASSHSGRCAPKGKAPTKQQLLKHLLATSLPMPIGWDKSHGQARVFES